MVICNFYFSRSHSAQLNSNVLAQPIAQLPVVEEDNADLVQVPPIELDRNPITGESVVEIQPPFASFLKEHQVDGIKFMYKNVVDDYLKLENGGGGGCILAHAMGLGKTLQVITLIHTLVSDYHISPFIKKILIVVPKNVIFNWALEFNKWFEKANMRPSCRLYEMIYATKPESRYRLLAEWDDNGGVMLMTASTFSNMVVGKTAKNGEIVHFRETRDPRLVHDLLDPGADLLFIDEAHLMKNDETLFYLALSDIATKRRVALTGTPLQNNLFEYYVMVNYVRPNFLGTKTQFRERFVQIISAGECKDSDPLAVQVMKRTVHVLNRRLEDIVHRKDFSILTENLPPKYEVVLSFQLTEAQKKIYQTYMHVNVDYGHRSLRSLVKRVFVDLIIVNMIVNHPFILRNYYQKKNEEIFAQINGFEDDEDDDDDDDDENENENEKPQLQDTTWFEQFLGEVEADSPKLSAKYLAMLFILEEAYRCDDKVIIFSQSLFNLDFIEDVLVAKSTQSQGAFPHRWKYDTDYLRLDGGVSAEERSRMINDFNNTANRRMRLFLISSRAGGLGINLIGANRCIIFDCTWNPTTDSQALSRIFRFGQTKPCYVYRFIAFGTMENVIYRRQVQKTALSYRVLDRSGVTRHYLKKDILQLYNYEEPNMFNRMLPALPPDDVLKKLLLEHDQHIVTVHEHDSLLANKESENLSWSERQQAWNDFLANRDLGRAVLQRQPNFEEEEEFVEGAVVGDYEYSQELEDDNFLGVRPPRIFPKQEPSIRTGGGGDGGGAASTSKSARKRRGGGASTSKFVPKNEPSILTCGTVGGASTSKFVPPPQPSSLAYGAAAAAAASTSKRARTRKTGGASTSTSIPRNDSSILTCVTVGASTSGIVLRPATPGPSSLGATFKAGSYNLLTSPNGTLTLVPLNGARAQPAPKVSNYRPSAGAVPSLVMPSTVHPTGPSVAEPVDMAAPYFATAGVAQHGPPAPPPRTPPPPPPQLVRAPEVITVRDSSSPAGGRILATTDDDHDYHQNNVEEEIIFWE